MVNKKVLLDDSLLLASRNWKVWNIDILLVPRINMANKTQNFYNNEPCIVLPTTFYQMETSFQA